MFYLCRMADIIISSTTPARSTPIIKTIKDEKELIVSLVELATSDVKLEGNVIKESIFFNVS